jgi:hypothetical protein
VPDGADAEPVVDEDVQVLNRRAKLAREGERERGERAACAIVS